MFKNLHSNRDPRDTLLSEVKKEFGSHFKKAGSGITNFMDRQPKFMFGAMVTLMLTSITLSLTVLRPHPQKAKLVTRSPVSDGFSLVFGIGDAIKETIALKNTVDTLTKKKVLTGQDSITLEKALDRLQQIKQQLRRP